MQFSISFLQTLHFGSDNKELFLCEVWGSHGKDFDTDFLSCNSIWTWCRYKCSEEHNYIFRPEMLGSTWKSTQHYIPKDIDILFVCVCVGVCTHTCMRWMKAKDEKCYVSQYIINLFTFFTNLFLFLSMLLSYYGTLTSLSYSLQESNSAFREVFNDLTTIMYATISMYHTLHPVYFLFVVRMSNELYYVCFMHDSCVLYVI
jgi:hypothetical protein